MAHETRTHAVLSASASKRWLSCPPSAKLNAELPDTTSEYAREGTCAHELAEYKVNKLLGIAVDDPRENLDFYDSEMEDCTDSYVQYISEQMSQYATPVVMVEQRLDFSKYVPGGFASYVLESSSLRTPFAFLLLSRKSRAVSQAFALFSLSS